MDEDDGTELRRKQTEAEQSTFDRKMKLSPLTQSMLADGWEIEYDDDVPSKQMAQLYKAQVRLHYGADDEYLTILGQILKRDKQKNMQINKIASDAVKHAPPIIAATMSEAMTGLDEARGNMVQSDFYERLAPYQFGNPSTWNPGIADAYQESVTRVCNQMEQEMRLIAATPLADFMTWKTQLVSGTNSGDWLYESLDKDQWTSERIPELMDLARKVATGSFNKATDRDWRSKGIFTMFGRTPDRPVHAVAMFEKMIGAKLNFDLTRGIGNDPSVSHIAWMSLDSMLERAGSSMAGVEATIHEDFKRFDSYVGPELNKSVLEGFRASDFLKSAPENREIFDFLVDDLTTPTWLRIAPHYKAKMRGSLYSGTPVTQIHGSIIHMAFIDLLKEEHGFNVTDYMVLSDDGFCTFDGTQTEAQKYVDDTMIPMAADIGMILNDKKSYVADITRKKVMYNRDGDKIVRHDVGPFLQKFPQINPDHAFGNVPRLIRSLKGRERDFERESYNMLFQLLPNMRRTERGDRAQIANWVQDFWRTLEVTAQVRPGYPRAREMIQTITKIYPRFWDKFDKLVSAAEASGDVLFDRATERAGGSSDKGTTRWLVNYLKEARELGSFPKLVES